MVNISLKNLQQEWSVSMTQFQIYLSNLSPIYLTISHIDHPSMGSLSRWGFLLRARKLAGRKTGMSAYTRVLSLFTVRYLLLLLLILKLLLPLKKWHPQDCKTLWVWASQHTTQTTSHLSFGISSSSECFIFLPKIQKLPITKRTGK